MCEKDIDACFLSYKFVGGEFGSVVSSDGFDVFSDGGYYVYASVCDALGVFPVGKGPDPSVSCKSVDHSEDGVPVVLADDKVHFEVSEARAVSLRGSEADAFAVSDRRRGRDAAVSVFKGMSAMLVKATAVLLVLSYKLVYAFDRHHLQVPFPAVADYLLRRPVLH